jgi:hypothetical protein
MAIAWIEFRCKTGHAVHLPRLWVRHRQSLRCFDCRRPLKPVAPGLKLSGARRMKRGACHV